MCGLLGDWVSGMTTPTLRPYQQQLADEVRSAYRQGFRCPLVVASTGAGKTVLFSYITFNAAARGTPVIAAAHRKEIIRQIALSFAKFGIRHEIVAPPQLRRAIWEAHEQGKNVAVVTPNGGVVHVPFSYTLEALDPHEVVLRAPGGLLVHHRPERALMASAPERARPAALHLRPPG